MRLAGVALFFDAELFAAQFSRSKLADYLGKHGGDAWFEALTEQTDKFIFVTAVFRQVSNLTIFVSLFAAFDATNAGWMMRYGGAAFGTALISLFCSTALPQVVAKYSAAPLIGFSAPFLHVIGVVLRPLTAVLTLLDDSVKRILNLKEEPQTNELEQEILSAVEEGESRGLMDEQERELIENVIDLRDLTAGHIMTARTDMVALEVTADLDESRAMLESTGHSRLPVFDGTVDRIVGILHARDMIKYFGRNATFQMHHPPGDVRPGDQAAARSSERFSAPARSHRDRAG